MLCVVCGEYEAGVECVELGADIEVFPSCCIVGIAGVNDDDNDMVGDGKQSAFSVLLLVLMLLDSGDEDLVRKIFELFALLVGCTSPPLERPEGRSIIEYHSLQKER